MSCSAGLSIGGYSPEPRLPQPVLCSWREAAGLRQQVGAALRSLTLWPHGWRALDVSPALTTPLFPGPGLLLVPRGPRLGQADAAPQGGWGHWALSMCGFELQCKAGRGGDGAASGSSMGKGNGGLGVWQG